MSLKKNLVSAWQFKMLFILLAILIAISGCRGEEKEGEQEETTEHPMTPMMDDDGMMMEDPMMGDGPMEDHMMGDQMRRAMMSEEMGPEMMEDMRVIRKMLMNHQSIERRVENLQNGVKTWTTSSDPEISDAIKKHVRQMKERMEKQQPIRQMDPVFRELFRQADKIQMHIEDLENGVLVIETSEDPEVVKLIQQHANRAVSEFAEHGMKRAMQPTPLPEGYKGN